MLDFTPNTSIELSTLWEEGIGKKALGASLTLRLLPSVRRQKVWRQMRDNAHRTLLPKGGSIWFGLNREKTPLARHKVNADGVFLVLKMNSSVPKDSSQTGFRRLFRSPESTLSITVIVAFVLVAGAAISAYSHSSRAIQTGESIEKSQELLGGLESILSIMTDMKFQAESFVKTGDISAKERYAKDKVSLGKYIKFVTLKGDEEGWRRWHFAYMEQLKERFENSLDNALSDKSRGKPKEAEPDLGKATQLMEMIRGRLIISDVDERAQLRDRLRDYKHHAEQTSIMFLSLGGFIFLFVVPLTLIVQRYIGATQKAFLVEQQVSREIVQHAPISIVQLTADFKIKDVNPVFSEYLSSDGANEYKEGNINNAAIALSTTADSVNGKYIWDLLPDLPRDALSETISTGTPATLNAVPITKIGEKNGIEYYWDIAVWPMMEGGKARSLIVLIEDITDKIVLSRQKEVLQQTIAHDLKSPLIASNYLIQAMLKKNSAAKNGEQELLLRLQDSNQDALTMVKNMLEISKYRQGAHLLNIQPVDLTELVKDVIAKFDSRCELSEVTIELKQPSTQITLNSDSASLKHLIGNLIENAIKFSPAQSVVTISLKHDEQQFSVDVHNTGPGIHEDDKEKLFTPFWQGEIGQQTAGGTGIGLFLCQQIAQALGGKIGFVSDEKSGTTFTVVLPNKSNLEIAS